MNSITKKICLLGPEGVGKTSLIRRFVDNSFDDEYRSTIGVQISQKDIKIDEKNKLQLIIWDLEGFDISTDYPITYLSGSAALIFVCDASRLNTSSEIIRIYQNITQHPQFNIPTCVALNKADLLSPEDQEKHINDFKKSDRFYPEVDFFLTSAKSDNNVQTLFNKLSEKLWLTYNNE